MACPDDSPSGGSRLAGLPGDSSGVDAGGNDPLTAQMAGFARVMCERMFACCPERQIDTEMSCGETLTKDLLWSYDFFNGASISKGAVRYRSDLMAACQQKLAALSCGQIIDHAVVPECLKLFDPQRAIGAACMWGYDCIDGWCKGRDTATESPGTCASFTPLGAACTTGYECAQDGACTGKPTTCQPGRPVSNLSFGRGLCSSIRQNAIPRPGPSSSMPDAAGSPPDVGGADVDPAGNVDCGLGDRYILTDPADWGTGSVSAVIDGLAMDFPLVRVHRTRKGSFGLFGLKANKYGLVFNGEVTPGTIACGENPNGSYGAMSYSIDIDRSFSAVVVDGLPPPPPDLGCSITYESVATKACERWKGSFRGKLYGKDGVVTITNGRFDIVRTRP